ncbi:hypothetical protein TrLO_g8537 [Triparma laevis f. longispina]|uniref:Ceramidase n=1 Tax=Triparma laevis f. longispina TaxID=1714387 RepID=A0A9W7F503_9STRA|nr:hypothetical protein TrLO_g8537 [Triparma laevis f. longispina]
MLSNFITSLKSSTTTLHIRPTAWKFLSFLLSTTLLATIFVGLYCDPNSDRCPIGNAYSKNFWGPFNCRTEYCESSCPPNALIKAPVDALSNVTFVLVGYVIAVFGWEDYYYFNHSSTKPKESQDYTCGNPPNLLVGGAGPINLLTVLLGSSCLIYAGIGSFVFHGGMTDFGLTLDMASVWTLVSIILPYLFFNHFHYIKLNYKYGRHVIVSSSAAGMVYAFILPFTDGTEGLQPTLVIPIGAGLNFMLLVTNYLTGWCYIKVRKRTDAVWLLLAVTFMGIAYNFQDDMKYCISATSAFQGHAVWHSCMAIGVGFFYLFLRQERRIEGVDEMTWKERSGSGSGGERELMKMDLDDVVVNKV